MEYEQFLESKQKNHVNNGFDVSYSEINDNLFEFQKFCVQKAIKAGKYALFQDCGLGKTLQQLEWAYHIFNKTNKKVLIVAPLAVTNQTLQEAYKFGYDNSFFDIINYENLHKFDANDYSGVVLDESSILKAFDGKRKKEIIDKFTNTPFKLACTATPSPNDPMEIGNHAEFLDVMTRNEMLAMYFIHDGGNTSKWRLKGHAKSKFYQFISEWAIMLNKPDDIGFCMSGYDLPKLNMIDHVIETDKRNNGQLFNEVAVSATNFNQELRDTQKDRIKVASEIANSTNEQVIVWVRHNQESSELAKIIDGAVEVVGSDDPEEKKSKLLGFANGDYRVLVTKSKIAQFGMNFQNCNKQVFASLDFSFESLYQSIRRSYRFGQEKPVDIHLITTDTMKNVKESIKEKEKNFREMQQQMANAMNQKQQKHKIHTNGQHMEQKTDQYHIKKGDCVRLISGIDDESIGLSIFSPPFAELYTYSSHIEDMGNSKDYNEFMVQFGYLVKELFRVTKQGRNVIVHCMDLPVQKGKEGYIGIRDFSGMILREFEKHGFIYHSRVTIWKDPVIEMQRTKALGLLHKQLKKDATMSRVGIPDYLMVFRKDGERNDPVKLNIPVEQWQKWASPVWMDINYSDTLQFRTAKEQQDEKHICPLQLETIKRSILLWSNEGDKILDPFAGIGSVPYQSVLLDRYGIGFELKESYYELMRKNMMSAVKEKDQLSIF